MCTSYVMTSICYKVIKLKSHIPNFWISFLWYFGQTIFRNNISSISSSKSFSQLNLMRILKLTKKNKNGSQITFACCYRYRQCFRKFLDNKCFSFIEKRIEALNTQTWTCDLKETRVFKQSQDKPNGIKLTTNWCASMFSSKTTLYSRLEF